MFVLLVLMLKSQFSLLKAGATYAHSQAQGNQRFRPPSCLTSRGAGIENSAKKWFSAHCALMPLMLLVFSLAYRYTVKNAIFKMSETNSLFE